MPMSNETMSNEPLDAAHHLEQLLARAGHIGRRTAAADPTPVPRPKPILAARRARLANDESARATPAAKRSRRRIAFFPPPRGAWKRPAFGQSEIESIILRLMRHPRHARPAWKSRSTSACRFRSTEKDTPLAEDRAAAGVPRRRPAQRLRLRNHRHGPGAGRSELSAQCSYCGTVPVSLEDYAASVAAQSLDTNHSRAWKACTGRFGRSHRQPGNDRRLGRAIASGWGLFLHGAPGNGKTSIAERITAVYGTTHLDSPRDQRLGRDHPRLRSELPRRAAAGQGRANHQRREGSTIAGSASAGRRSSSAAS